MPKQSLALHQWLPTPLQAAHHHLKNSRPAQSATHTVLRPLEPGADADTPYRSLTITPPTNQSCFATSESTSTTTFIACATMFLKTKVYKYI